MESFSWPSSHSYLNHRHPVSLRLHLSSTNLSILSFPHRHTTFSALKTSRGDFNPQQGGSAYSAADLLRKPAVEVKDYSSRGFSKGESDYEDDEGMSTGEESWVDWEDRILEDTVPLVGFVRMILHSGKYESGERLSSEHENIILQRLLAHHPESEKKIGCGIDYIMVGHHPDFESSRCLFIVRKDGEVVDFSYWKCVKAFIRKNILYKQTLLSSSISESASVTTEGLIEGGLALRLEAVILGYVVHVQTTIFWIELYLFYCRFLRE